MINGHGLLLREYSLIRLILTVSACGYTIKGLGLRVPKP